MIVVFAILTALLLLLKRKAQKVYSIALPVLLGMLLAIPLSAFCVVLWRALKATYLRPNA